jgi:hypothetical protein
MEKWKINPLLSIGYSIGKYNENMVSNAVTGNKNISK